MENTKVEMYKAFVRKKRAEIEVLELEIADLDGRISSMMRLDMLKRAEDAAIAGIATLTGVDKKDIRRLFEVGDSEGYLTLSAIQHIAKVPAHKANDILKDMERRGILTGGVVTDVPNGNIYISLEDRQTSIDRISEAAAKPAACYDCGTESSTCETTPDKCDLLNPKGVDDGAVYAEGEGGGPTGEGAG